MTQEFSWWYPAVAYSRANPGSSITVQGVDVTPKPKAWLCVTGERDTAYISSTPPGPEGRAYSDDGKAWHRILQGETCIPWKGVGAGDAGEPDWAASCRYVERRDGRMIHGLCPQCGKRQYVGGHFLTGPLG